MSENILICGVNWLGDTIMSMPALRAFRIHYPDRKVTLLCRAGLAPLWEGHPAVDQVVTFEATMAGTLSAGYRLRKQACARAFIFPNSFRSAFIPWLAGVPERIGVCGHNRRWLLSDIPQAPAASGPRHQAFEYFHILGMDPPAGPVPAPGVPTDSALAAAIRKKNGIEDQEVLVGIFPGAARGPAKRWPAAGFIEVGKAAAQRYSARVLVLGTASENELCEEVARGMGDPAVNLAGRTSLSELMAVLADCRVVISNDSGGMHLAAGVGTPVVAIFGLTDSERTGPLGEGHEVITAMNVARSRDIARVSREAEAALRSITPEQVMEAVWRVLDKQTKFRAR